MKKNILAAIGSLILVSCANTVSQSDRSPSSMMCVDLFDGQHSAARIEADKMLTPEQRMKKEVRQLEEVYKRKLTDVEHTAILVTEINTEITQLKTSMTWSERKLWSGLAKMLGGDPKKIDELKTREQKKKSLESLLEKQQTESSNANQEVVKFISNWLKSVDQSYKEISQIQEKMHRLVCDGNACISQINSAIFDAETARSTTNLTIIQEQVSGNSNQFNQFNQNNQFINSKNQQHTNTSVEQLAAMQTATANLSAQQAQMQAQNFISSISSLKGLVESSSYFRNQHHPSPAYNNFLLQSIFNYQFDFIPMLNMFNLNNITSNLYTTKSQVEGITNQLKQQNNTLKEQIENAICRVRSSCQIDL